MPVCLLALVCKWLVPGFLRAWLLFGREHKHTVYLWNSISKWKSPIVAYLSEQDLHEETSSLGFFFLYINVLKKCKLLLQSWNVPVRCHEIGLYRTIGGKLLRSKLETQTTEQDKPRFICTWETFQCVPDEMFGSLSACLTVILK